jgi:hypothetical protein
MFLEFGLVYLVRLRVGIELLFLFVSNAEILNLLVLSMSSLMALFCCSHSCSSCLCLLFKSLLLSQSLLFSLMDCLLSVSFFLLMLCSLGLET